VFAKIVLRLPIEQTFGLRVRKTSVWEIGKNTEDFAPGGHCSQIYFDRAPHSLCSIAPRNQMGMIKL
jgi:hypothetical protein